MGERGRGQGRQAISQHWALLPQPPGPSNLLFTLVSLLLPRRSAERAHLPKAGLELELQARLSPGPPRPQAPPLQGAWQGSRLPGFLSARALPHSHWTPRLVSKVTFENRVLGPPQAGIVVAWSSKDVKELLGTARAGCPGPGCALGVAASCGGAGSFYSEGDIGDSRGRPESPPQFPFAGVGDRDGKCRRFLGQEMRGIARK